LTPTRPAIKTRIKNGPWAGGGPPEPPSNGPCHSRKKKKTQTAPRPRPTDKTFLSPSLSFGPGSLCARRSPNEPPSPLGRPPLPPKTHPQQIFNQSIAPAIQNPKKKFIIPQIFPQITRFHQIACLSPIHGFFFVFFLFFFFFSLDNFSPPKEAQRPFPRRRKKKGVPYRKKPARPKKDLFFFFFLVLPPFLFFFAGWAFFSPPPPPRKRSAKIRTVANAGLKKRPTPEPLPPRFFRSQPKTNQENGWAHVADKRKNNRLGTPPTPRAGNDAEPVPVFFSRTGISSRLLPAKPL